MSVGGAIGAAALAYLIPEVLDVGIQEFYSWGYQKRNQAMNTINAAINKAANRAGTSYENIIQGLNARDSDIMMLIRDGNRARNSSIDKAKHKISEERKEAAKKYQDTMDKLENARADISTAAERSGLFNKGAQSIKEAARPYKESGLIDYSDDDLPKKSISSAAEAAKSYVESGLINI